MGPPGTFRTECTKQIAEEMNWHPIQVGYLMKEEESKKTNLGSKINEAKKAYHYGMFIFCAFTHNFDRYISSNHLISYYS
jgi:hypothetical protein